MPGDFLINELLERAILLKKKSLCKDCKSAVPNEAHIFVGNLETDGLSNLVCLFLYFYLKSGGFDHA